MRENMQSKIGKHQEQVMDTDRGLYPGHAAVGAWADLGSVFGNRQALES